MGVLFDALRRALAVPAAQAPPPASSASIVFSSDELTVERAGGVDGNDRVNDLEQATQ